MPLLKTPEPKFNVIKAVSIVCQDVNVDTIPYWSAGISLVKMGPLIIESPFSTKLANNNASEAFATGDKFLKFLILSIISYYYLSAYTKKAGAGKLIISYLYT